MAAYAELEPETGEGQPKLATELGVAYQLTTALHADRGTSLGLGRTRTPAVRKVLNGYTKPPRHPFPGYYAAPAPVIHTPVVESPRRGYWKRYWSQR